MFHTLLILFFLALFQNAYSEGKNAIITIAFLMHEKFHRCGGFIYHPDLDSAHEFLDSAPLVKDHFIDYTLNQESKVLNLLAKTDPQEMLKTILKLSSYGNRYFKAKTGKDSQLWLKSRWEEMSHNRPDILVETVSHSFLQPSVVLTIKGKKYPEEAIILGGHGDSINVHSGDREHASAPGADDNASGIAVLTEILRVLVEENYYPERTIKLISYAAEEVGLRGSKEIAKKMKDDWRIQGVLQFDMTAYQGGETEINLISDNTSPEQNEFVEKLIDRYLKVSRKIGSCGYACSDHASWHNLGIPVSFPFESSMDSFNPKIHSNMDNLDNLGNNARHAALFAKLGLSFLVELDQK
jgi:leucyl aminopeptidase